MDALKSVSSFTRSAYDLAAGKYHDLFHNEINEKEYDRRLLDSFSQYFKPGSFICDAGCGPSAHIGRYLFEKGLFVTGIDISENCIKLAQFNNPGMSFGCADISRMPYKDNSLEGIIAYYSIINTPRIYVNRIFSEFNRVLKNGGFLLVAVKAGSTEGYADELLGFKTKIYTTLFSTEEISGYFSKTGFEILFIEKRKPYEFEIDVDRIFAIGRKHSG